MKEILRLGQKQWFSGVSPSSHLQNSGLFFKGDRINPFVDPFPGSSQTGIFQTSADPIEIGGDVVTDTILAGASRITGANLGNLYLVGDGGSMYALDLSTDTVTSLRSGTTVANPANGIGTFQAKGGTKNLYYTNRVNIGKWDFDGPTGTFTDEWSTSLSSTLYHPFHFFKGAQYFGNKNAIGSIYDVSGVVTTSYGTSPGGITFAGDFITTCIEDDGDYLVAGITTNLGDNTLASDTRVIFWDTFSQNFNKEWPIPDFSINAITKFENGFLAHCGRGTYYFNSTTKPTKIKNLDTALAVAYGYAFAADVLNEATLWGGGGGGLLSSYGKIILESPRAYLQPFAGLPTTTISFIESNTRINKIYVANLSNNFYAYSLSGSGGTSITVPETIFIDLKQDYHIQKIDFSLAEPLAVGDPSDSLTVGYQKDEDTASATWATVSYNNYPGEKYIETFLDGGVVTNQIKFLFNFTAGNVKIKDMIVYGEPIRGTEA